jgi:hypothetical protein
MHVHALRETYPSLAVSLLDVVRSEDRLVAEIEIQYGSTASPGWLSLDRAGAARSCESFRITGQTIQEYRPALFGKSWYEDFLGDQIETMIVQDGRLTAATISLPANQVTYLRVPGPGFLLVRQGVLEVAGGATKLVSETPGQAPAGMEPGESRLFSTGAMIASTVSRVTLRNPSDAQTTIEFFALVAANAVADPELPAQPASRDRWEDGPSTIEAKLESALQGPVGAPVRIGQFEVTLLFRATGITSAGGGIMEAGIVWLPPGASVMIDKPGAIAVTLPISGEPTDLVQTPATGGTTRWHNSGHTLVRLILTAQSATHQLSG